MKLVFTQMLFYSLFVLRLQGQIQAPLQHANRWWIDSMTQNIQAGKPPDFSLMTNQEMDDYIALIRWLRVKPVYDKLENNRLLADSLNILRRRLVDSTISLASFREDYHFTLSVVNQLFALEDDEARQFLVSNHCLLFNGGAWHNDYWKQCPVAYRIFQDSKNDPSWFPFLANEMKRAPLVHPSDYFFTEIFKNMFGNDNGLVEGVLRNYLSQFPDNEILAKNIESVIGGH